MIGGLCQPRRVLRPRQAAPLLLCAILGFGLGGCGRDPLGAEVDLYHGLQGGAIAQQRPPPPGLDDPYPKLGTIPPRPAAPDVAAQQSIADRLAAERDTATRLATASPLVVVAGPSPAAKADATKPGAAPAKADEHSGDENRVVIDAAPSPPASPVAAGAAPASVGAPSVGIASLPPLPAAITSGPVPNLAAAPPQLPIGLGVEVKPASEPVVPAASSPSPPPPAGAVTVPFTPGSAVLPPSATLNLRRFALAHKGVALTITGHGEAVLPGAEAQARALDLALRRAEAIAQSLSQAGVPAANLRLRAEAAGQGGAATL